MAEDKERTGAKSTEAQGEASEAQGTDTVNRDDPLDVGVPMLPSEGNERQGPEDALGVGPKRGDYRNRIGSSLYNPTTTERIPEDERETDDDGNVIGAHTRVVEQRPRAEDIGDEEGLKGGVETDPAHPFYGVRSRG